MTVTADRLHRYIAAGTFDRNIAADALDLGRRFVGCPDMHVAAYGIHSGLCAASALNGPADSANLLRAAHAVHCKVRTDQRYIQSARYGYMDDQVRRSV